MPSTFIIKLNNFALSASLSSVLPFMSVYFLNYTKASPWDFGKLKLISSWVGIAFKLTMCSLADRYRAYRSIYLIALLGAFISLSGLFVPIFLTTTQSSSSSNTPATEAATTPDSTQDGTLIANNSDLGPVSTTGATNMQSTPEAPVSEQTTWLYYVSVCIIVSSMCVSVCKNLNDSFTANITHLNNIPFGSVRIYGSLGWIAASILLVIIDRIQSHYFLLKNITLYAILGLCNLLIVFLWPDKEPFELDLEASEQPTNVANQNFDKKSLQFKFLSGKIWPKLNNTLFNCKTNTRMGIEGFSDVTITKAEVNIQFDTRAEDAFRNIRRCSLAPLGDSFVIKQFELDNQGKKHFNHVTKIHPVGQESSSDMPTTMELIVDSGGNSISRHDSILSAQVAVHPSYLPRAQDDEKNDKLGFLLHCRIIRMIASRNKSVHRFWLLSVINGFIISMSWTYLIPYLKSLDACKFGSLSAYILMINQLCQIIFYRYLSPYMSENVDHFTSISIVQIGYGLRYFLYLLFSVYDKTIPLEMILLVESTHLFGIGWLTCVTNELALQFALEAHKCIPELIRLNLIQDADADRQKVNNAVKVTMLGLSSCCFEGLGVAFGALASGWMVSKYGFVYFWIGGASLATLSGLINGLINLKDHFMREDDNKCFILSQH